MGGSRINRRTPQEACYWHASVGRADNFLNWKNKWQLHFFDLFPLCVFKRALRLLTWERIFTLIAFVRLLPSVLSLSPILKVLLFLQVHSETSVNKKKHSKLKLKWKREFMKLIDVICEKNMEEKNSCLVKNAAPYLPSNQMIYHGLPMTYIWSIFGPTFPNKRHKMEWWTHFSPYSWWRAIHACEMLPNMFSVTNQDVCNLICIYI